MINKLYYIENNHIGVAYHHSLNAVVVVDKKSKCEKNFAGWSTLLENYESFWESFSENIVYNDAIEFFTPNIANTIIHAK